MCLRVRKPIDNKMEMKVYNNVNMVNYDIVNKCLQLSVNEIIMVKNVG